MATGIGKTDFKSVVELERDGLRQAIRAQDTLWVVPLRKNQLTRPMKGRILIFDFSYHCYTINFDLKNDVQYENKFLKLFHRKLCFYLFTITYKHENFSQRLIGYFILYF